MTTVVIVCCDEVRSVQECLESLRQLRVLLDNGELSWASCERLLERKRLSWIARHKAHQDALKLMVLCLERHATHNCVLQWSHAQVCSGPKVCKI